MVLRNDKILCRINRSLVKLFGELSAHHVKAADADDFFPVKLDSIGFVKFHVGRIDFYHVAFYAEGSPFQNHVVALVLDLRKLYRKLVGVQGRSLLYVDAHRLVELRHS